MFFFMLLSTLLYLSSCGDSSLRDWEVSTRELPQVFSLINISDDLFDSANSISEVRKKHPYFLDNETPDSVWNERRNSSKEKEVYLKVKSEFAEIESIERELEQIFKQLKLHYPEVETPQVYVYSSGLSEIYDPVVYSVNQKKMFIALDAFLGEKELLYSEMGTPKYIKKTMDKSYLSAKVAFAIAEQLVPINIEGYQFIDQLVYQGKLMNVVDALLPKTEDHIKMAYSQDELNWCQENEYFIWNYFVKNQLLFSHDNGLQERFINLAPFSKFYNSYDKKSPGSVGVWLGWKMVRKYMARNPKISLMALGKEKDTQKIFREAKYKPKK